MGTVYCSQVQLPEEGSQAEALQETVEELFAVPQEKEVVSSLWIAQCTGLHGSVPDDGLQSSSFGEEMMDGLTGDVSEQRYHHEDCPLALQCKECTPVNLELSHGWIQTG